MWVWRDDMARGGWRLDAYGTWIWDEPSPLDRAGAGTGALAGYAGASRGAVGLLDAPRLAPEVPASEPTPIFRDLTADRIRRDPWDTRHDEGPWAAVPEPHPGSGPLPVQDPDGRYGDRALASVPTVPPPPLPSEPTAYPVSSESPEDELRRRAERRRRPRADTSESSSARHSWRREEPHSGRHSLRG